MGREKKCAVCGALFEMTGNTDKYCKACRIEVVRQRDRDRRQAVKNARDEVNHTCDCKERIEMCLSCTRDRCTGDCEALRLVSVGRKRDRVRV